MQITLNGESYAITQGSNITGLLQLLSLEAGKIAVERNAEIVPTSTFNTTVLQSGDVVEIVHFIGGG